MMGRIFKWLRVDSPEIRHVGGWRGTIWAWYDNALDWIERVAFCHHNARVLSDMEWRLGCVLNAATETMSKPYYDLGDMLQEINNKQERDYSDGYAEGRKDAYDEMGVPDPQKGPEA